MSMELYVFLNQSAMPEPEAWQKLISAAGFDLRIDTDFDPITFTGFLPCQLDERQTGFEYYFAAKETIADEYTYIAPMTRALDSVVTFVWGGSLEEMCAAMMAAGALAASTPALIFFAEDDSTIPTEQALPYTRQQVAEAKRFLKH